MPVAKIGGTGICPYVLAYLDAMDPPPDPVPGFEHDDIMAARHQFCRGREPGNPCADDNQPHPCRLPICSKRAPGDGAARNSFNVSSTLKSRASALSTRVARSESPPETKKSDSAWMSSVASSRRKIATICPTSMRYAFLSTVGSHSLDRSTLPLAVYGRPRTTLILAGIRCFGSRSRKKSETLTAILCFAAAVSRGTT